LAPGDARPGQLLAVALQEPGRLVFGLASLLNILLYPRLRSRNLKLWAPDSGHTYDNLPGDFAGVIRWDWLGFTRAIRLERGATRCPTPATARRLGDRS